MVSLIVTRLWMLMGVIEFEGDEAILVDRKTEVMLSSDTMSKNHLNLKV